MTHSDWSYNKASYYPDKETMMKTAQMQTNPVKKFMEQVNRPATHKDKRHDSKKYACRKFNQRNHKDY